MYIYNVTTNVDESIHEKWLHWMKQEHIPKMLESGKFSSAKMCQVMVEEDQGVTYSVQYTTDSKETLEKYYQENAAQLRQEGLVLFKERYVAFRTELKVINHVKNFVKS